MSYRTLQTAASGMEAFTFQLDSIANNLANAGTTGYKRSRVNFEDLFYEQWKLPGALNSQGQNSPLGVATGLGARVKSTQLDFREGSLLQTGKQLDLTIAGDGFFQVTDPASGRTLYTRDGSFTLNNTGQIVMGSADQGRLLEPNIQVPNDTVDISISGDGVVSVRTQSSNELQNVGQIQLARFINPEGMLQLGENLYQATDASGTSLISNPGLDGTGLVRQGYLEASNVEPVQELVDMIKAQRSIELNSQALQAGDQMLQLLYNLR
jgi:flagellar basal-body rod protein FlgG